jgi:D-alanyl-D-alanine carboxypeptidase/D-alanyl-D-alanine-endopeptidase (penicillin-binding protein 4)
LAAWAPAARAASPPAPASAAAAALPPEVRAELQRAGLPVQALSLVIEPLGGPAGPGRAGQRRIALREHDPVNPASLMKLPTTVAALDRLGPAWRWSTPVWLAGPVRDGVLQGDLHLQGRGDPTLVVERVWLLLRRVQAAGVREIRGDIVLDNGAFAPPETDPGEFDGEPLRPYNVRAQALLLNQHAVVHTFTPDAAAGVARVTVLPALAGAEVQATVPLGDGPCADWRRALQAGFGADGRTRFAGRYPAACGELDWPVADPAPATYNARLLAALWREMGGTLGGRVREGPPPAAAPSFEWRSPPLAEVVRDINKFSNNVMAQMLFLTLGATPDRGAAAAVATPEAARAEMRRWLAARLGGDATPLVVDNGSGLSRENRLTAQALARLLQQAYDSPTMPELMSSLPVTGLDGTLRRSRATPGRAHLKTGSLRDVAGVAGYVLGISGQRYVLVALLHHPAAGGGNARATLDALVQWTLRDLSTR